MTSELMGTAAMSASLGSRLADNLTAMPTVVFTALLMFCGAWWLLSLLVAGLDGDGHGGGHAHAHGGHVGGHVGHAGHGHAGHDAPVGHGHAHDAHGHHAHHEHPGLLARLTHVLGIGALPLSFGLTLFAFGAWAVSLLGQTLLGRHGAPQAGRLAAPVAIGLGVVAVIAGDAFVGRCAKLLAPIFQTSVAPTRDQSAGALCRVRLLAPSLRTGGLHGTADVISGPTRGATVAIHVDDGDDELPVKGGVAVLVAYDEELGSFLAVKAPPGIDTG